MEGGNAVDSGKQLVQKEGLIDLPRETLNYFDGDEIRARVFYEKYALKDMEGNYAEKIPPEMWARVAREMASVESTPEKMKEWEEKFGWLLGDFRFVPGGRIMFGAGQKRKTTLLNCYVIPEKGDTIEDIFEWMKEAARTYSYGGGVGTDISILRPRGSNVNNSAIKSTGSVSFMNLMSETTHTIGQNARRGALMITLSVDHPDILDFIKIKRNLKTVRYANISVRVTDEFMRAVESDSDFVLRFENPVIGRVERVIRAKELWNELVQSARDWAEPGLIFWDTVKKYSPSEYNGMEVISTNPCVTGETPVLTPKGWRRVDSLKVGEDIVTAYGSVKPISEIYVHQDTDVYRIRFTDGGEVNATPGHIFHTRTGRVKDRVWNKFWNVEKRLDQLKVGDMVRVPRIDSVPDSPVNSYGIPQKQYGFMMGVLLGDGCYTQKIVARGHAKIASDYREKEWNDRIIRAFRHVSERISVTNSSGNSCYILLQKAGTQFILNNTLLKPAKSFEKELPTEYINSCKDFHLGLVDGIVSTDGNLNMERSNPTLRISSTSKRLLEGVRSILLFYGIHAKIYGHKAQSTKILGRDVNLHKSYVLYVYGHDLTMFASIFSLSHPEKQKRLERIRDLSTGASSDFTKIASIDYLGKSLVYDIYEKETDTWITNGYASRGCSEQPLQAYGACDLGSINLSQFVINPFSDNPELDWKMLEKATRYAVRFLDNVLDYNMDKHPLKAQTEASKQSRRIGVGATGLADMLAKLKIKYDSEKALAFVDQLFNEIKKTAYDESCEIAREKGSFVAFDKEKHLTMPFIKTLEASLQEKIADYGLRNVAILTIPPVGSGSVLTGTSSGIEPIFTFSYVRRSETLSQEYFKVYHPLVKEYMKTTNIKSDSDLPEFFVPAHKIVPDFRVKLQGIIQRHVDSAISSTVNLDKDVSVEAIEQIYFQAWKAGCKGITVYREGSREGILLTEEQHKLKQNEAKGELLAVDDWRRPQVLIGKTIKFEVPQGTLYLTANMDNETVKEVFITLGRAGSDEKSYTEAIGKLASKYLQQGGDIKEVISSLKGIRSNSVTWEHGLRLYSIPDAIAKALEMAMGQSSLSMKAVTPATLTNREDTPKQKEVSVALNKGLTLNKAAHMGTCPKCSEPTLANENGCINCLSCGYTKCE